MKKNDEITVTISGMSSDGSGIGKYEGMAIFIPDSAEGDVVKALILKVKKTYAYGKIIEIITPSPDRIVPDCAVFHRCGGCAFRHITYSSELKIKESMVKNNLSRIGGLSVDLAPIISLDELNYRNKAQYPIGVTSDGEITAGFYAVHSHRVIDNENCLLQPPVFADTLRVFKRYLKENDIAVYDETTHEGLVRHLYLRMAKKTGEIMVVPVINGSDIKNIQQLVKELKDLLGDSFASLILNINKENTNVILGEECKLIYGKDFITDVLCGLNFRISPLSFYQVNRDMAEKLYEKVAEYAEPQGKIILDLYCGAGTIGLSMAKCAKQILGVEIVPQAVNDAVINAENNDIKNARFICGDAKQAAKQLACEAIKPEVVVIDPPRKGCEKELIEIIANDFAPERVIYVSCDSATLARDCKIFMELGYKAISASPADLFPRTAHVECVTLLVKSKAAIS